MIGRRLSAAERRAFALIALPAAKLDEALKGRILYGLKRDRLRDADLAEAFPDDWKAIQPRIAQKPLFSFLNRTNCVIDYFLSDHNRHFRCKVLPAIVLGFRAERFAKRSIMIPKVRYPDGRVENVQLGPIDDYRIDIGLHDRVLVHRRRTCYRLTAEEYQRVVDRYFKARPVVIAR